MRLTSSYKRLIYAPINNFIAQLKSKPHLFNSVDVSDDVFANKLVSAVRTDYDFFRFIPLSFRSQMLYNTYLGAKLAESAGEEGGVTYSYEGYPTLLFPFESKVECMDRAIDIPVDYTTKGVVRVNIVDAEAFYRALDMLPERVTFDYVRRYFIKKICAVANQVLVKLFETNIVTYYNIAAYLTQISKDIEHEVDFASYGMRVIYCAVREVSIPDETRKIVSDGYMAIRLDKINDELALSEQRMSIELFKAKADIYSQTKYPEKLTEYEKDKALQRYLKKIKERPTVSRVVKVVEVRNVTKSVPEQLPVAPDKEDEVEHETPDTTVVAVNPQETAVEEPAQEVAPQEEVSVEQIAVLPKSPAQQEQDRERDENPRKKHAWWGILLCLLMAAGIGFIIYALGHHVAGIVTAVVLALIGIIISVEVTRAYNRRYGFDLPEEVRRARELNTYLQETKGESDVFVQRNFRGNTVLKF